TSSTTIGIRGTVLYIRVGTTGSTVVDVIEGAIVVHPKHGDKDVMAYKGQRAIVAAAGEDATVTTIPTDIDDTDASFVAAPPPPPAPHPAPRRAGTPARAHSSRQQSFRPGRWHEPRPQHEQQRRNVEPG